MHKIKNYQLKGMKVAVKLLKGKTAAKSVQSESRALELESHDHLVTTHCIVTDEQPDHNHCTITWRRNSKSRAIIVSFN